MYLWGEAPEAWHKDHFGHWKERRLEEQSHVDKLLGHRISINRGACGV